MRPLSKGNSSGPLASPHGPGLPDALNEAAAYNVPIAILSRRRSKIAISRPAEIGPSIEDQGEAAYPSYDNPAHIFVAGSSNASRLGQLASKTIMRKAHT
jgi:hypothetical protein